MSILLDGTGGVTTPGVVNTAGETIATTLSVTGASTFTGTGKFATTIGVGNATPAASGSGITFPATQSASSDANTLDDYEEGTWTPTAGGTSTYSTQSGQYVKIGKLVYVNAVVVFTAIGTGSTNVLSGLPFTDGNVGGFKSGMCSYFAALSNNLYSIYPSVPAGTTTIDFRVLTVINNAVSTSAIFGNSTRVDFSAFYFIS